MPFTSRRYTVDDVRHMPEDGNRHEAIEGVLLVTPAPGLPHQDVLGALYRALWAYADRHELGRVYFAPTDVVLGPTTLVQPDLLFVRSEHRGILAEREVTGAPDLVVEVVSRSSAATDRGRKRVLYQNVGVGEYWVVDRARRRVEVWRPGATAPEVAIATLRWQPDSGVLPLVIELEELFEGE